MDRAQVARDWLTPKKTCPNCRAPPAFRIPPSERDRARLEQGDTPMSSYQCPVSWCQTVYVLRAKHYQLAD